MKKLSQDQLDELLLESLLFEQGRKDREQRLQEIENALNEKSSLESKSKTSRPILRIGIAAAAAITLWAGWLATSSRVEDPLSSLAQHTVEPAAGVQDGMTSRYSKTQPALPELQHGERRRMMAEGGKSTYAIPESTDTFDEMSALSSLEGDVSMSGGLGGSRSNPVPASPQDGLALNATAGSGSGVGFGKGMSRPPAEKASNSERYGALTDPSWQLSEKSPLSTFSIDVDNASYSNIRRMIRDGQTIPPDAVRIEECINAFNYHYPKPTGSDAFAVHTTLATCPWNESHLLMKIGIKGREIAAQQRPASNLVFLIDVSGSMQDPRKLPLVKESLKVLLQQLDERDSVAYVVYAGSEGVVLPPTKMTESGRNQALEALAKLEAGGSTNGGSGIMRAYEIARKNFVAGGVNRVILASDGDFNVGVTDTNQIVEIVKQRAAENIYLSVLSFGTGNLNDALLESISKDGNGNYYYIDSIREGRRVFLQRLSGTLITIAKDVKIQLEFNPALVGSYRLVGYANRVLKNEDFKNDKVDAGDIGAGHTVTAFYEMIPAHVPQPTVGMPDSLKYQKPAEAPRSTAISVGPNDEWLTLKIRHKSPEGDISSAQESVVKGPAVRWQDSGPDFSFASAVSIFGMKLRGMDEVKDIRWSDIRAIAQPGVKNDTDESRSEFISLLDALEKNR